LVMPVLVVEGGLISKVTSAVLALIVVSGL